jgi:hypothetical protein
MAKMSARRSVGIKILAAKPNRIPATAHGQRVVTLDGFTL